jgi:quercetin dioxygenase-like cupin family protein
LIFALHEHPNGAATDDGPHVVYDLDRNQAHFASARVEGPALVWELADDSLVTRHEEGRPPPALEVEIELDDATDWVVRCDRVDFPPGSVAYRHVHPGPGIRRLLFGALTIDAEEGAHSYREGEAWFEDAGYPVQATSSDSEATAFVRVLLLPAEWAAKRTIRYLDPADEAKPKLQRAEILLEEALRL